MKRVLIVDDSSYMRLFVKKIIQKMGSYIMSEASTKEDAIEIFKNENPEIVMLDLNISEHKEGISVLTEIININPKAIVIIISAVGYEDVKDECLALGARGYLKKPFEMEELLQVLKEYN